MVAVGPGGVGPASSAAIGHVLDRPVTGYELALDPIDPLNAGDWMAIPLEEMGYQDMSAPAPTITRPSASASQGSYEGFVRLSSSGASAASGAAREYAVRATSDFGPGPSASANGWRAAGALSRQWERSAGTSASEFSPIAGATESIYDDYDAPADGATRWYRVVASIPGGVSATSEAVAGSRLNPASLVPTGVSASQDLVSEIEVRWSPVAGACSMAEQRRHRAHTPSANARSAACDGSGNDRRGRARARSATCRERRAHRSRTPPRRVMGVTVGIKSWSARTARTRSWSDRSRAGALRSPR